MTLTSKDKGWLGIVVALWLIILVALIFIVPKGNVNAAPTGSLAATLSKTTPAQGPALMTGAEVDPAAIYGEEYQGLITLCGNEPAELQQAKATLVEGEELDLSGAYDYVLVLPLDQVTPVRVDQVDNSQVTLCPEVGGQPLAMQQALPINTPLPFYKKGSSWVLGYLS